MYILLLTIVNLLFTTTNLNKIQKQSEDLTEIMVLSAMIQKHSFPLHELIFTTAHNQDARKSTVVIKISHQKSTCNLCTLWCKYLMLWYWKWANLMEASALGNWYKINELIKLIIMSLAIFTLENRQNQTNFSLQIVSRVI